ncbi:TIGR02678 family protein [Actinokineospora diospyrosa]|uniref:TIGR02678 family protein n=2 Tax=Actinokineospora diospyrosa TaxID=103728 RepID=A0ABT1IKF9_9PSEU|nr:TIGR02678 family protein [Actinokineospora diospyrosa]
MHPIITAAERPEDLALIRGHAAELKTMFKRTLNYQLVIESGFARLLKTPLSQDTVVRPALATNGTEFAPRTYAYLALVCASLLSPNTGEQVLMSELVEQVRADAVTAAIAIDDTTAEQRHLVRAISLLVTWGVLSEVDGSVAGWEHRQDEEALLDVHRGLLPHLLTRSLRDVDDPGRLISGTPVEPLAAERPRRDLRRKLVENPLVRREDLPEAERDVLSRERRELTRVLEESFGLVLEVRAEGALAYDVDDDLSDVRFPGTGTTAHAALLLVNALTDELRPTATTTATIDERVVPGAFVSWDTAQSALDLVVEQYGSAFAKGAVADQDRLRTDVLDLLQAVSLAVVVPGGFVLHPAAARYRPEPHRAPAKTRAQRRLDDAPPALFSTGQSDHEGES